MIVGPIVSGTSMEHSSRCPFSCYFHFHLGHAKCNFHIYKILYLSISVYIVYIKMLLWKHCSINNLNLHFIFLCHEQVQLAKWQLIVSFFLSINKLKKLFSFLFLIFINITLYWQVIMSSRLSYMKMCKLWSSNDIHNIESVIKKW